MNKEPRMAWIHAHQTKIKKEEVSHNESKSQIIGGYEDDDDGDGDGDGIGADNGK